MARPFARDRMQVLVRRKPTSRFPDRSPKSTTRTSVRFLFAPYARELAARVVRLAPSSILEIAAGTGVLTREIARADAMALPYPDRGFDVVVCQFGVMFFPDRIAAFREARRVLARGGTYLFSVWAGIEDNDAGRIVAEVVATAFPHDPPVFLQRTPYGHGDPIAIEADLRAAGFSRVACDDVAERSRADSARGIALGLIEGSPLRNELLARDPDGLADIVAAAEAALVARLGEPLDGAMRAFVFRASAF